VDSSSSSTAAPETPLVKISASDLFVRKQPEEVEEETSPDPPALETSAEERYYLIDKKGNIARFIPVHYRSEFKWARRAEQEVKNYAH
jgi:hypothetical protein